MMCDSMVSIIIPIYNSEAFLKDCLESVLIQTYQNFEVLLIDDGSTDASSDICDAYACNDSRFKKFSKKNGGLSSARNYGLSHALGDYIIFLDSDDYWCSSSFLEELVSTAVKYDLDLVRGELREVDVVGNTLNGYRVPKSRVQKSGQVMDAADFFKYVMCRDFFVVLSLYKRQALYDMRFDESQRFQEDIEFNIKLFLKDLRCIYLPICFYAYRRRSGSLTTEINVDRLKYSFRLADIYSKNSSIANDSRIVQQYMVKSVMMYYWTLGTLAEDPYFQSRQSIILDLNLDMLQLRTRSRLFRYRICNRALLVACVPPKIGVCLLRCKNILMSYLYKLIS